MSDALGRWLGSPEGGIREAVVAVAAGCPEARGALDRARADTEPAVRLAAVLAICETPGEPAAAAALESLEAGDGGKVRYRLIQCASPAGYAPAVPFLTRCLRDLAEPQLASCMVAARRVGDRRLLPLLRKIGKKHPERRTREIAKRHVREFGR